MTLTRPSRVRLLQKAVRRRKSGCVHVTSVQVFCSYSDMRCLNVLHGGLTKITLTILSGHGCCRSYKMNSRWMLALAVVVVLTVLQLVFGISSLMNSAWRAPMPSDFPLLYSLGADNQTAVLLAGDGENSLSAAGGCQQGRNMAFRLLCTLQRILTNMTKELEQLSDEDVSRLQKVFVQSLSALWRGGGSGLTPTTRTVLPPGVGTFEGGEVEAAKKERMQQEKIEGKTQNVDRLILMDYSRQAQQMNAHRMPLCPYNLSMQSSPHPVNLSIQNASYLESMFSFLSLGGSYSPPGCQSAQKTAIIIPYRNRWEHLHVLLYNLVPFLVRQMLAFTIFVIEMEMPTVFNRALLLNVGVLEALKLDNYTCFIFHDVDLIPLDDRNLYLCGPHPRHLAVAINKFHFSLPYAGYFGGVAALSREHVVKVNGNSNLYFGWGGEDDDLYYRTKAVGLHVVRYPQAIGRYEMISHGRDMGNSDNNKRWELLKDSTLRMQADGLNSARYRVQQLVFKTLYTWVTVSVNSTEVLQAASV